MASFSVMNEGEIFYSRINISGINTSFCVYHLFANTTRVLHNTASAKGTISQKQSGQSDTYGSHFLLFLFTYKVFSMKRRTYIYAYTETQHTECTF